QFVLQPGAPPLPLRRIDGEQLPGKGPQVLASMVEINDLHGAGELPVGDIPDPDGSVAENDLFIGAAPASPPGFGIKTAAELFSRLDSACISSRSLVAHRPSLLVDRSLRKQGTEFHLACMRWLIAVLPLPALGFSADHGYTRAIHFDIQDRNARSGHDGQVQLAGSPDLG